jgi:hypothetical protein
MLEEINVPMEFELRNTTDFIEKVKDVKVKEDEVLVSFDVGALFPSIPVESAINTIKHHIS